jgi:hypothetical protein
VGTPVDMLQVSGCTKNSLDRQFAFFVTCNGAPAGAFKNVKKYLDRIFGVRHLKQALVLFVIYLKLRGGS